MADTEEETPPNEEGMDGSAGASSDATSGEIDSALDQSEIDDLFSIGMDEDQSTGIHALINNKNVQHKRLPLLEACFDRLLRDLTASLRKFTSANVELSMLETKSVRFGGFIETIPVPALISVFRAPEWDGFGLIVVNSPLVYAVLDLLLGGRQVSIPPAIEGRSFTSIELVLVERLIKLILADMSAAFQPLGNVSFRHERVETNPSRAAIAYPADTAISLEINIDMDDSGGQIGILIPYATLEPVLPKAQQMFMGENFGRNEMWEAHWAREMLSADAELEVLLGQQTMSFSDIMALEVGSTLKFRVRPDDLVTLRSGDLPLFRGQVGRLGDSVAIRIEDRLSKRKGPKNSP